MGFFSRFENKMEDAVEGTADKLVKSPISPVQISKQCEKCMMRNKMVGAGKQYAPTLYTVLVNAEDDAHLFSFYPTLAGEIETAIRAKAAQAGLFMDGQPLVRFIVDDKLKHGKFDVIAEVVSSGIVTQLRAEEMERYGLTPNAQQAYPQQMQQYPQQMPQQRPQAQQYAQAPAGYGNNAPALVDNQGFPNDNRQGDVADGGQFANDPYAASYNEDAPYDDPYDAYAPSDNVDPYAPQSAPEDQFLEDGYGAPSPTDQVADPYMPSTPAPAAAAASGFEQGAPNGPGQQQAAQQPAPSGPTQQPAQQPGQRQSLLIDNTNGHTYELTQNGMIAGRAKTCSIIIPDINASRQHARFTCDEYGHWTITDLGSKNGTLVNGGFINGPTPIYDGDTITLGLTTYMYTVR